MNDDNRDFLKHAVDLSYTEPERELIVNWDGPVKPDSQRAHRSLAFHLLYAVDRSDSTATLKEVLGGYELGFGLILEKDSLTMKLASGVLKDVKELDETIGSALENWELGRLSCSTRLILRLTLWEMLHLKTAPSIIIDEAIELTKAFAEEDSYKLVNGVLDRVVKDQSL